MGQLAKGLICKEKRAQILQAVRRDNMDSMSRLFQDTSCGLTSCICICSMLLEVVVQQVNHVFMLQTNLHVQDAHSEVKLAVHKRCSRTPLQ